MVIPDLVPIIIFENADLEDCIKRGNGGKLDSTHTAGSTGCIKRVGFERGIPIWKAFVLHFWAGSATPLGGNWTLSPEDWEQWQPGRGNNYLGRFPKWPNPTLQATLSRIAVAKFRSMKSGSIAHYC